MLTILTVLYETCCTGWRPKKQNTIHRMLNDVEELAEEELERLFKHLSLKRQATGCCAFL